MNFDLQRKQTQVQEQQHEESRKQTRIQQLMADALQQAKSISTTRAVDI
jgi:hypothetical protein